MLLPVHPSRPSSADHPSQPQPAGRRRARAPRAPVTHRWLGPFYCATAGCDTILGEMFADAQGTFLSHLGGGRLRLVGIQCPVCGQLRQFRSQPAPAGPSPAALAPLDESGYDLGNRNAGTA